MPQSYTGLLPHDLVQFRINISALGVYIYGSVSMQTQADNTRKFAVDPLTIHSLLRSTQANIVSFYGAEITCATMVVPSKTASSITPVSLVKTKSRTLFSFTSRCSMTINMSPVSTPL